MASYVTQNNTHSLDQVTPPPLQTLLLRLLLCSKKILGVMLLDKSPFYREEN